VQLSPDKEHNKGSAQGNKKNRDEIEAKIPHLKRGRPSSDKKEESAQVKELRAEKKELYKNRYLFVKRPENLTQEEKEKKDTLSKKHLGLAMIGACMIAIYDLFDSKNYQEAQQKHKELITSEFATNEYTKRMIARIQGAEKFEKAFLHLRLGTNERTTNHVERQNRWFRKIQKSCNKLRRKETIEKRIDAQIQTNLRKKNILWQESDQLRPAT